MRSLRLVSAGTLIISVAGPALLAAEGPAYSVSVVDTKVLYTATPAASSVPGFKPHINFPWLSKRGDGSLEAWWTVGQTHGVGNFGLGAISTDNGQTWSTPSTTFPFMPPIVQINPVLQTSRGFDINHYSSTPFSSWQNSLYTSTNGGLSWSAAPANYNTGTVTYISMYQNPGAVVSDGTALLINAFGQRPNVNTFESVLFASTDGGVNWTRRSTISPYVAGPNASMGEEGPNESDVIQLSNGNLLAVYRTGQPFPNSDINSTRPSIFFSISSDHGFTWSSPKMLGVMGSYPHLNKLDDGSIAMTYGRYGVKVMVADPTGTRWSRPFIIHDESTSGYVRMHRRSDGKYVLAYDHSSFYPPSWNSNPPPGYVCANDQLAYMKAAILDIRPEKTFDYYNWALEYHGDVTPDQLATPWTASTSGSVSAYLWADLGQDYIRTDSGANDGNGRSIYYTLSGTGTTEWSGMDFAAGVVAEFRARVGRAGTPEGSANIFLGDGAHGYISVELTDNGVDLEGLGGNAGQANYLTAQHPGFSALDWHDYRLVIAPDPAAGGAIRANLYLDSDKANPILTQTLNATNADELRFGDQTGANNGVLDLDYLRFAAQLNQWGVDADGNWSSASNWTSSAPGGTGAAAFLLNSIHSPRTITVDAPVTVGRLVFDNPNRYTIAGASTLSLQVGSGSADITLVNGNHTIAVPLSLLSNTVIQGAGTLTAGSIANSASLSIQTGVSAGGISGTGTINVAAGQVLSAGSIRQGGLSISGTAAIRPDGSIAATSRLNTLLIAGTQANPTGRLDLADNDLVIDYPGGASPIIAVRQWLRAGSGGGWTGNGIASSSAAATPGAAIGYREALSMFGPGGGEFSGIAVDGDALLLKYTYAGDASLDGQVDVIDLGALATSWQTSGPWDHGDFNYDGFVDVVDLGILASNWQAGVGNPLGPASLADALAAYGLPSTAVPEPLAAGALALPALALQCRRYR